MQGEVSARAEPRPSGADYSDNSEYSSWIKPDDPSAPGQRPSDANMKENEQGLNAPAVPQSARSAAVAGASERVGPPASDDPRFTTPGSLEVTPSPTSPAFCQTFTPAMVVFVGLSWHFVVFVLSRRHAMEFVFKNLREILFLVGPRHRDF